MAVGCELRSSLGWEFDEEILLSRTIFFQMVFSRGRGGALNTVNLEG